MVALPEAPWRMRTLGLPGIKEQTVHTSVVRTTSLDCVYYVITWVYYVINVCASRVQRPSTTPTGIVLA